MRVISGTLRGKKLITLEGTETRPTLDRVKESLFNILQYDIEDANVLDLFAGSGSLGIEALSRKAKHAVFCDKSPQAIEIIKENIKNTRFLEKSLIINKDYNVAIEQLSKENKRFNIVFLDPPYKTDFGEKAVDKIIDLHLLEDNGIIVFETDNPNKEEILKNKNINVFDNRKYGRVMLIFIRKE